jgi:hypothetical protein
MKKPQIKVPLVRGFFIQLGVGVTLPGGAYPKCNYILSGTSIPSKEKPFLITIPV